MVKVSSLAFTVTLGGGGKASSKMSAGTIFETAIHLATQAVAQDKAKNYPEAARCYREAVATFASVRGKCATPQVRLHY